MPPPLDQNSVLKSIDRFDDSIFVSVSGGVKGAIKPQSEPLEKECGKAKKNKMKSPGKAAA